MHDFTTICAPAPLQAAAVSALNLPDTYYAQVKTDYAQRRETIMSILLESNFIARPPEGAYYILADFGKWNFVGDDYDFARWLPQTLGVAVVPASCFYGTPNMGKRQVRFAFAKKLETLNAAGERLRRHPR